jgi:hypothetical protein
VDRTVNSSSDPFVVSSDPSSLTVGQRLGRYELLAPIERGGMGQVWVARLRGARGFHKLVAVKTLLSLRGEEERMERMLLEEARIASLIQHSNVVQTLELGEHEGTLYLVMEWVDGEPLSEVLAVAERCGGVPLLVAVNLIGQTLRGLQAAHELCDDTGALLGVVHRDVSPHNVLVSYSGTAKLVDFGIAQAVNQRAIGESASEVQGKFPYLAPEQIMGGYVDQRTDLFAVGILLYLLTTGRHPFKDHAADGVLHNIMNEDPAIRPSLIKATYSRTLEAVVMKALDKDRDRRWPSAEEMRLALERGVPQAFSLGFESQMRNFMADTVGDRAAAKRDALRRAELAADEYLLQENAALDKENAVLDAHAAPSAGSLRAILIDQEVANGEATRPSSLPSPSRKNRASRAPTLRPVPLSARRVRWPQLAAGVALMVAALVLLALGLPSAPQSTATSPGTGMVDLTPPRAAPQIAVSVTGTLKSPSALRPAVASVALAPSAQIRAAPAPNAAKRPSTVQR